MIRRDTLYFWRLGRAFRGEPRRLELDEVVSCEVLVADEPHHADPKGWCAAATLLRPTKPTKKEPEQ